FVERQADAPVRITEALRAGDLATAERMAHTVSGVAGNLGAGPVHTSASVLAQAIRSGADARDVEEVRQRFANVLAALTDRLRPFLAHDAAADAASRAGTDNPEVVTLPVGEMRKRLDEFDPGAVDVLQRHHELFRALLGDEDFAAFDQHVRAYAF